MDRRRFLKSSFCAAAAGVATASQTAHALISCTPFDPMGRQQCEAGIDSNVADIIAAAVNGQHMTQWCWAACIETVFRYYGLNISQQTIVLQTWGGIVNLPAQPHQILANLNRPWVDDYGRGFQVVGDAMSANPVTAAQDLSQNMPLIIGTQGHAMVLTSLTYIRDGYGNGDVMSAIVRDPWPGRGRRVLSPQEWYGTSFLARIRVFS